MCPHKVDVNVKFDLNAMQYIAHHRRMAIEECIESLTHSCLCHDAFCRRSTCLKTKRVVIHTSICKRKIKGNCPICKQLIALCCYHAKNCRDSPCNVPFCNTVKTKMRQQNMLFDRLDAARDQLRQQLDAEESDTIDVNMSGPPAFSDDMPSGSGLNGRDAAAGSSGASVPSTSGYRSSARPGEPQPRPHDDQSDSTESEDEAEPRSKK